MIHSLTKYFGGHSDITGGSITAAAGIIEEIRPKYLLLGCCLDPYSSWLTLRSIRTMGVRVQMQNRNAQELAHALESDVHVKAVYHPSLKSHPQHKLSSQIFTGGYGAMLSFRVEDSRERVNDFMRRLSFVKYLGTLGGIRTTCTHPATAFQNEFSREALERMGMSEGLIRVSTGMEEIQDIIADFKQALQGFD